MAFAVVTRTLLVRPRLVAGARLALSLQPCTLRNRFLRQLVWRTIVPHETLKFRRKLKACEREMGDPLAGLPAAFVAHTAERFAKSYAADLHGLSADAVATRCGVAIRTAFRLELSMPLPEAPAPCDEALRGKIAALRSRHPDLLRRKK